MTEDQAIVKMCATRSNIEWVSCEASKCMLWIPETSEIRRHKGENTRLYSGGQCGLIPLQPAYTK